MIGAFDNSTIEFGIADHSPSTVKHQVFVGRLVQGSSRGSR